MISLWQSETERENVNNNILCVLQRRRRWFAAGFNSSPRAIDILLLLSSSSLSVALIKSTRMSRVAVCARCARVCVVYGIVIIVLFFVISVFVSLSHLRSRRTSSCPSWPWMQSLLQSVGDRAIRRGRCAIDPLVGKCVYSTVLHYADSERTIITIKIILRRR